MKKHSVVYIITILLAALMTMSLIPTEVLALDYSQFHQNTANNFGGIGETWQNTGWYSNGLLWQVIDDDTNLCYVTSSDAITWSSKTVICPTRSAGYICLFNLVFDGTYVHYVYADDGGVQELTYRRGLPQSNGVINWNAADQVRSGASKQWGSPSIAIDSNGYPWVTSTEAADWDVTYPYAGKSSTKDGTWTEEFWTQLNSTQDSWQCIILPLSSGKMLAIYGTNSHDGFDESYSRLWNGASWEGGEFVGTDTAISSVGAASYGNEAYYAWMNYFREYQVGSGWGTLEDTGYEGYSAGSIGVYSENGDLYRAWFSNDTDIIYIQHRSGNTWEDPTEFINVNDLFGWGFAMVNIWREDSSGRFGIVFTSWAEPSPYKYYFTLINLETLYYFYGTYNEITGEPLDPAGQTTNVTVFWTDKESISFHLNGSAVHSWVSAPLYFSFELPSGSTREYWVSPSETQATIYVFDETLTSYTIQFLDLSGALNDYPFIEIKRYINGSLMMVEKRKVDTEDKIMASLVNGDKYVIEIKDGASYTFGDVLFTSDTTVTLILKGIEFPQNIILAYRYVRIYAYRHNNLSSISVTFEETQSLECDVDIDIQFENGTSVSVTYPYTYNDVTDFNHTWTSAEYNITYVVKTVITHPTYGEMPYNTILARSFSGVDWTIPLGNIPSVDGAFLTSSIIPLVLIFGSFLLFSRINSYVAAFVGTGVATLLAWWNWIPIPAPALVGAFFFAIILALEAKKKEI